jgi:Response regulator containing CheY-like receiver domain and AraC-type DNA-binding domain
MENYTFPLSLNLIVAEDEIASSLYIKTLLKKYISGDLWMAKDGATAWDYFQQYGKKVDLIITDINMPKMDGIELSKRIRSLDENIPIVITTAFDNTSLLKEAIEVGVYQYILKPVQSKQIEQVLLDIFERKINEIRLKNNKNTTKYFPKHSKIAFR